VGGIEPFLSLSLSLFLYGRAASGLHSTLVASPKHLHVCQWKERDYRMRGKKEDIKMQLISL